MTPDTLLLSLHPFHLLFSLLCVVYICIERTQSKNEKKKEERDYEIVVFEGKMERDTHTHTER